MVERKFNIVLFGATGMVGKGVLLECMESDYVHEIISISRSTVNLVHPKLKEIVHSDFEDYSAINHDLTNVDACFFCLGISSIGMKEEKYHKITYDYTISAAEWLKSKNEKLTMMYVSGTGTDSTENGNSMWARVKGKTENKLFSMFKSAYMFRPGYIQPMKGVKSKVAWYQALYTIFGFLYPVLKLLFPKKITNTVLVGKAMINAMYIGYSKNILENNDINILAKTSA